MVEIQTLWLILLINGCAVSVVLLLAWLLRAWWQNRRDYRAMRSLAQRVREGAAPRRQELRRYIGECCRLPEAEVEKRVAQLDQAERQLVSSFIGAYLRRDARAAEGFDFWVSELAAQYHLLTPAVVEHSSDNATETSAEQQRLRGQIEAQKVQLNELKRKLAVSYETIDRMLKEYSQMFSGGDASQELDRDAVIQLVTGEGDDASVVAVDAVPPEGVDGATGDSDLPEVEARDIF